ncbi:MAG TPA: GntR family transcriptional regulator [Candidatus Lumbricidophila sp.]|nr:GntR family transcriptional regulator [Candidatus Lumbricidophila sp.]
MTRSVLSDETYSAIRNLVLTHEIEPGARLNIDALALQLGVSPTPVREALARLESDGLVLKTPMRGYTTTALLTMREFSELTQLRLLLEPWTARESALRSDAESAEALRAELAGVRAAIATTTEGPDTFRLLAEHDVRFHGFIAQMSGNELIAQAFERMHYHLHTVRTYLAYRTSAGTSAEPAEVVAERLHVWESHGPVTRTIENHAAIAEAIIAGDADLAEQLMRAHIAVGRDQFLPIVELNRAQ